MVGIINLAIWSSGDLVILDCSIEQSPMTRSPETQMNKYIRTPVRRKVASGLEALGLGA
jgi:hypothetical protein